MCTCGRDGERAPRRRVCDADTIIIIIIMRIIIIIMRIIIIIIIVIIVIIIIAWTRRRWNWARYDSRVILPM